MKVGDWVLVTPDEFDRASRKMTEPLLAKICKAPYKGRAIEGKPNWLVRVKPIFYMDEDDGYDMYVEQCVVVIDAKGVKNDSQSNPA